MKKKMMIISSMILVIGVVITTIIVNNYRSYTIIESGHIIKDRSNLVGVVLLQESDGSSTYIEQTGENADTFPTSGYHLNTEKSKCENGGTVSYDSTNKKVLIDTNMTDKCYIYFDLGDAPSGGGSLSSNYSYSFHIMLETEEGSGEYIEGTYAELQAGDYLFNKSTSYCDDGENQTSVTNLSNFSFQPNKINCYLYYVVPSNFAEKIIQLSQTNSHIIYHNGTITPAVAGIDLNDITTILDANDDSYRYAGSNETVNDNYVCFGYDRINVVDSNSNGIPDVCESSTFSATSDYAYRIIGVFKDVDGGSSDTYYVKLIKSTSYTSYTWIYDLSSSSLNRYYLTTLTTNGWEDYLAQPIWNVGGCFSNGSSRYAKIAYTSEMTENGITATNNTSKIGLMYVNDYAYAASNSYWTSPLGGNISTDYRNYTSYNWLFLGSEEWTISKCFNCTNGYFYVHSSGSVTYGPSSSYVVRPVLYLSSSTKLEGSGLGTVASPYLLAI